MRNTFLQEIAEEIERRARFSGQLRERFTACTEIEEYRSIKCWHRNRGGVLLHRNRGEVRPAFNAVRLHLFAQKSRSTACYFCCTVALITAQFSRVQTAFIWHRFQGSTACIYYWHKNRDKVRLH